MRGPASVTWSVAVVFSVYTFEPVVRQPCEQAGAWAHSRYGESGIQGGA